MFNNSAGGGGGLFGNNNNASTPQKPTISGMSGNPPAGNLGGLSLGGNATGGGGLFGGNNNNAATASNAVTAGGSLFGGNTTATTTPAAGGGLFGGNTNATAATTTTAGGGLFGGNNTTTAATTTTAGGGLFGTNSSAPASTTAGGGLFGGGNTTATTTTPTAGGGLFGGNAATTTSAGGGLFGGNTTTTPTTGGLFGGNTNTGGIFGNQQGSVGTNTNNAQLQQQQQQQQKQLEEDKRNEKIKDFYKNQSFSAIYTQGIENGENFGENFVWEIYNKFNVKNPVLNEKYQHEIKVGKILQNQTYLQQLEDEQQQQNIQFIRNYNNFDQNLGNKFIIEEKTEQQHAKYIKNIDFSILEMRSVKVQDLESNVKNSIDTDSEFLLQKLNQVSKSIKSVTGKGYVQPTDDQKKSDEYKINQKQKYQQISQLLFRDDQTRFRMQQNFLELTFPDLQQQQQQQPQQQQLFGAQPQQQQNNNQQQQKPTKEKDPKFEFFRNLQGRLKSFIQFPDKKYKMIETQQENDQRLSELFQFADETLKQQRQQHLQLLQLCNKIQSYLILTALQKDEVLDSLKKSFNKLKSSQKISLPLPIINKLLSTFYPQIIASFYSSIIKVDQITSVEDIGVRQTQKETYDELIQCLENLYEYHNQLCHKQIEFNSSYQQKRVNIHNVVCQYINNNKNFDNKGNHQRIRQNNVVGNKYYENSNLSHQQQVPLVEEFKDQVNEAVFIGHLDSLSLQLQNIVNTYNDYLDKKLKDSQK